MRGKGFTLVELLVVIAIIGLLSSVVFVGLSDARIRARDAKRISDVKQIQLSLELFYDAQSGYPTALASLVPTYMPVLPKDPSTGANYLYGVLGVPFGSLCPSYHIGATLENTANLLLLEDVDAAQCTGACIPCSGTDFDGQAALVYDLTP